MATDVFFDALRDLQGELWKHLDPPEKKQLLSTCRHGRSMVERLAVSLTYSESPSRDPHTLPPLHPRDFAVIGRMTKVTAFECYVHAHRMEVVLALTASVSPGDPAISLGTAGASCVCGR